ncbi:PP2C family serine/threonine-protein phosphatase [Dyadobacter sp. Leaf189]|uniref:PP2C family protein-serine/threonine phosphatase n=1 Tax=Dyadobacter sp. Leaf189 TaxID=1736295 RepID=UPI00191061AB|nr:protein phosphatase 2C domain-containing protein [Dyadobacter sp. Leaf189]
MMMNIEIYPPLALHEIGKRENNEDSILPAKGSAMETQRLFLVCDGVGGSAKGEEASRLVCQSFDHKLQGGSRASNPAVIADALYYAEKEIDRFVLATPEAAGMASTLTLLHLHENGATIAHVGDSRVYHIRKRMIRFVTNDHKWVNKLVLSGDLTPEEALHHPRRNVIDRAIQGHGQRSTEADVVQITDIRAGDYFFLCTDGILEGIEEEQLVNILATNAGDAEKLGEIESICSASSTDNFSAYLIRIKSVSGTAVKWTPSVMPEEKASDIIMTEEREGESRETLARTSQSSMPDSVAATAVSAFSNETPPLVRQTRPVNQEEKAGMGLVMPIVIALVCALLVLGGYFFSKSIFEGKEETTVEQNKPARQGILDPDDNQEEMKSAENQAGKQGDAKPAKKPDSNKKADETGKK